MENNTLRNLMNMAKQREFATNAGREMHARMQRVFISAGDIASGDIDVATQIISRPELHRFFTTTSQVEVPVAGYINGNFISRRVDRMVIDDDNKTVDILDYKTDITHHAFRDRYISQIREYMQLLARVYADYTVRGYLLWTHNWTLEEIS